MKYKKVAIFDSNLAYLPKLGLI